MKEGEVYRVSEVKLAGDLRVPESELRRLIMMRPGETYSQRLITQSHRSDHAAARAGRLRVRQDRRGAEARCARPSRCRWRWSSMPAIASTSAASISSARAASTTKCSAARCASSKARTCRTPQSSARRSACSACRSSKRSRWRRRRCPARRISSTSTSRSRKDCRASSAAASATRSRRASSSPATSCTRICSAPASASALEFSGGDYSKVYDISYTDPYFTLDGISRTVQLSVSRHRAAHVVVLGSSRPSSTPRAPSSHIRSRSCRRSASARRWSTRSSRRR